MDSAEISRLLKDGIRERVTVDVRESVTSTNTVLKELAEQGGAEGTVLIAEQQTMGKGRLGRSFLSPKGTGLYMSVLLRPEFSAEEALQITVAAAVAVAGSIEAVTGREAKIKWVNDVYLDGYKVCGILTEASADFENGGLKYAVLGIGVNLLPPEGGFQGELAGIAGALYREAPPAGTSEKLAAEILNRFFTFYDGLPARSFMEEYERRSFLTSMDITFLRGNERREGRVLGVDDEARLLVQLKDGSRAAFSAGEVSVDKDFLKQLREEK